MSRNTLSMEDLELAQIRETELQLLKRELESTANRQRIAQELSERERTLPPLEEIQVRTHRKQHELCVSRGEVVNILRAQNRSLMLLLLLVTATCMLVWTNSWKEKFNQEMQRRSHRSSVNIWICAPTAAKNTKRF